MKLKNRHFSYSVPWNLMLLTLGPFIFAIGLKAIAIPHGFITGGISGLGLFFYYIFKLIPPGIWYLVLNIPLFIIGWLYVSRRFFFYSLYGMAVLTAAIDLVPFHFHIEDHMLAVLAAGVLIGAGAGITLRSLGSAGGSDIVAVILNQKFNFPIGRFFFLFNLMLFSVSLFFIKVDLVLYSMALTFVNAMVMEYFLSMFNQRKMVIIISDDSIRIAESIMEKLNRGSTFLYGRGAYTSERKEIVLTVINNFQLKRLEEIVFGIDSNAFFIAEDTFSVFGKGFSSRKIY